MAAFYIIIGEANIKKLWFLSFILFLCINFAKAQTSTSAEPPNPSHVLVVYNANSLVSDSIMNYYQNARGIPGTNIIQLDALDTLANIEHDGVTHLIELTQGPNYEKEIIKDTQGSPTSKHAWVYFIDRIAVPIAEHLRTTIVNDEPLANTIRFIVLCKGVPFRLLTTDDGGNSCNRNVPVDALLCILGNYLENPEGLLALMNTGNCTPTYTLSNPYYNADANFSMDHNFIPNHYKKYNSHFGRDITLSYLITHLDATSFDVVKGMIDRSIAAENSVNYDWFIDADKTPCAGSSNILKQDLTKNVFDDLGIENYYIENTNKIDTTHSIPVMSYSSNGRHTSTDNDCKRYFEEYYIQNQLHFTFADGAVFNTAESHNANTLGTYPPVHRDKHGQLPEFFLTGGTVGVGQVLHGSSGGIIIDNSIMLPSYAVGYSFIEAAYMGMQNLTDTRIVVGDPLTKIYNYPIVTLENDSSLSTGSIVGRLIVPEGKVLTIPTGTTVSFERNASLRVYGQLIIEQGTNVIFTGYSNVEVDGELKINENAELNFYMKSNILGGDGTITLLENSTLSLYDNSKINISNIQAAAGTIINLNDNSSLTVFNSVNMVGAPSNPININSDRVLSFPCVNYINVSYCNMAGAGVKIDVTANDIMPIINIENSIFDSVISAITIWGNPEKDFNVVISDNIISNYTRKAISINGVATSLLIKNTDISFGVLQDDPIAIDLNNNGYVSIADCLVDAAYKGIILKYKLEESLPEIENISINLSNVQISNCETGIEAHLENMKDLTVTGGTIDYDVIGIKIENASTSSAVVTIDDVTINGGNSKSANNIGVFSELVKELIIKNCDVNNTNIGIQLNHVNYFHLLNNDIVSSNFNGKGIFINNSDGNLRENEVTGHSTGIWFANSSPEVGLNEIYHNTSYGLYVGSGSNPDLRRGNFGCSGCEQYFSLAGTNNIYENGSINLGEDAAEIYISASSILLDEGCNIIADDRSFPNAEILIDGIKINEPIKATGNYWGNNPLFGGSNPHTRFGIPVEYEPYNNSPCPPIDQEGRTALILNNNLGSPIDTLYSTNNLVNPSELEVLLADANYKYFNGSLNEAKQIYYEIISNHGNELEASEAFSKIFTIAKFQNSEPALFADLRNFYLQKIEAIQDSLIKDMLSQLSRLCLIEEKNYVNAIDEFDDVIIQNPNTEKAIYAEIDALTTTMLASQNGGSLGKHSASKYSVKNSEDYFSKLNNLINKLSNQDVEIIAKEIIPTEFQLKQNYPNPFNPSTTIEYSIPNPSADGVKSEMPKVKLVVYDLLGSVVRTLVDEQKSAGKHKVTFDASQLPSGVYFYQINVYAPGRAGGFNQVRKMLLLK